MTETCVDCKLCGQRLAVVDTASIVACYKCGHRSAVYGKYEYELPKRENIDTALYTSYRKSEAYNYRKRKRNPKKYIDRYFG